MSEHSRICNWCEQPCDDKRCEHCGDTGVFYPPGLTQWEIDFLNGKFFENIDTKVHCP